MLDGLRRLLGLRNRVISSKLDSLHDESIRFGLLAIDKSTEKRLKEKHISDGVFTVFQKVDAFGITLHRAVRTLCGAGWTQITPILLRSLMECSANCLAVINNDSPEYMAFKYLYYPVIQVMRNDESSAELKRKAGEELETGLQRLENPELIQRAKELIEAKGLCLYWFQPEEKSISKILTNYGGEEMLFAYGALSLATHGYHIGLGLFKDNSEQETINPEPNPNKTRDAILYSSRHLLELIRIRNDYEGLGLNSRYESVIEKLLSFQSDRTRALEGK